jgi:hypothetical protein
MRSNENRYKRKSDMVDMMLDHPITAATFDWMTPTQVQKALDRLSHTILGTIRWKKDIKEHLNPKVRILDGSGGRVSWEEPSILGSFLEIQATHQVYNPQSTMEKPLPNLHAPVGDPVVCWVGSDDPVHHQMCYRISGLPMDEEIRLNLRFSERWEMLLGESQSRDELLNLHFKPEMATVVLDGLHRGAFLDFEILVG